MSKLLHAVVAVVAVAAALAACAPSQPSEVDLGTSRSALRVCAGAETVPGIDVSEWQGSIDWNQVAAAGYRFAITRINDGHHMDGTFGFNWAEIKRVGMIRGAYQFYEPTLDSAWQAQVVIDAVGMLGDGDLPVTLDVEWPSGGGTPNEAAIRHWADLVAAGTGKQPMIYTAVGYWNSYFSGQLGDLTLWVANYGVDCPSVPSSWDTWLFWQPGGGPVPGIAGDVDQDLFNGPLWALQAVANANGGNHCGGQVINNCSRFGCGCVDNACSGGFCPGTGCSADLTAACGNFGVGCADGKCQGVFGPGTGCTAKETLDCGNFGCGCVDHKCNGGYCPGSGCTARETLDCAGFGVNCVDHKCAGGYGEGSGCTAKETLDCQSQGCGCADHVCGGGSCPGNGCTAKQVNDCGAKSCLKGACVDAPAPAEPGPDASTPPTAPDASTPSVPEPGPDAATATPVVVPGPDASTPPSEIVAPDAGTAVASGPDAGGTVKQPQAPDNVQGASCASAPGLAMPLASALLLGLAIRRRR